VRRRVTGGLLALVAVVVGGTAVLGLFPAWLLGAVLAALAPRIRRSIAPRIRRSIAVWPPRVLAVARGVAVPLIVLTAVVAHEVDLPFRLPALGLAAVTALGMALFVTDVGWSGLPGRVLDAASWTAHSSYSLYAIHMPIVVLLAAMLVPTFEGR
jgi:peptidoglycan/LPS O-acetylase OafA/YrhL